jgi:hypothetical protein
MPKPAGGDTVIDLDWLARTDPNNLYPFVIILPSQNIFVGMLTSSTRSPFSNIIPTAAYYNEARILEPVSFTTIKTLPNIPGAVNDCKVNFAKYVGNILNVSCSHCRSHVSVGRGRFASSTTLSLHGPSPGSYLWRIDNWWWLCSRQLRYDGP